MPQQTHPACDLSTPRKCTSPELTARKSDSYHLLGLGWIKPPLVGRRRPAATLAWCAAACSAATSNVPLKKTSSEQAARGRETIPFCGPTDGREKRFRPCAPSSASRRIRDLEVPRRFACVFSRCGCGSRSTESCEVRDSYGHEGLWTLAAMERSENHSHACGPARSSWRGRCVLTGGCRFRDRPTQPLPSRNQGAGKSKKSPLRNAENGEQV